MALPGCVLTSDYSFGCGQSVGGVKTFWIIETDNISSVTEVSGNITAITKASGKIFRKYQLVLETSNAAEDLTSNIANGTSFSTQTVLLVINKQQLAIRNEILLMSRRYVTIVAQDSNDVYHLYGRVNGLLLSSKITTGTAWADRNGYEITFTGKETEIAPIVDSAVISTLQT